MLVSYNWLKEFTDIEQSPGELADTLTMLGLEVEEVTDLGKKYDKFFTAEVLEKSSHPNADKLSVCKVSIGEGEPMQVVCGAPNVAAGQKVILGTLGAVVPSAGFALGKVKLRGVESTGMICSATELEIGEDSSGILVLPENTKPGQPLADYLAMRDYIIDISITPNKADCLSHLGIAREIAAFFGKELRLPDTSPAETGGNTSESIKVEIHDKSKCARYTARVVRGAKIGPSPKWLQNRLLSLGLRPINAPVDVTNLVMYELGHPLHAFDLDKVEGGKIIVRTARENEIIVTLDGKQRKLDPDMLLICDTAKAVAIGGVMGGENTEISGETTNILIESALFNPSSVRKTSRKLALMSDSSYRFERGADIENVPLALDRAAKLIAELTGGTVEKGRVDEYPEKFERQKIRLRFARASKIIGPEIPGARQIEMLERLGFKAVEIGPDSALFEIPSRRVDVGGEIDLIEEVARMYDYNKIDSDFVSEVNFDRETIKQRLAVPPLRERIVNNFISSGFFEVATQNQIDPKSAALVTGSPVKLANPLGEDLSIMRPSVILSILKIININLRLGNKNLRFFELGKRFLKNDSGENFIEGITEEEELVVAISGNADFPGWGSSSRESDFYDIKGIFETFTESLKLTGLTLEMPGERHPLFSKNTLEILLDGQPAGFLGDIGPKILKHFDIEQKVYIISLNLTKLYRSGNKPPAYEIVSQYPATGRDLAFIFDSDVKAGDVLEAIRNKGGKHLAGVTVFDLYEGEKIGSGKKSIAFGLTFRSNEKTLKDAEVEGAVNGIVKEIKKKFSGILRDN
jgi:phenylalanyl-tRNA synthetase beta chain